MTDETPKTLYLPADWLDEQVPNLYPAPADFAVQDDEGKWWLRLPEDDEDHDEPYYKTEIEPDHAYSFLERRVYPDFTLTVLADGTFSTTSYGAECNHFMIVAHNTDDIFETVDDLVERGNPELAEKPLAAGEYTVSGWFWSDDVSMEFSVVDGKPTFTERTRH